MEAYCDSPDIFEGPDCIQIKPEPDEDMEICSYPFLKKLSIKLTDCKSWLEGRDFLSLDDHPQLCEPLQEPHTNTGRKMIFCPKCEKGFYKKSHLEAHLHIHQGQKTNECWHCGKTYPTLISLVVHQQIHERSEPGPSTQLDHTGERPHACSCGKTFKTKGVLRHHLKRFKHHQDAASLLPQDPAL
ncbi:hypothetical protein OJAV_G00169370 [Oryzias javanicus]|uniref:C2H2-type domain-containing protein n=1 Tax=Oryzias javanicus TaxID=123683 RepID=A0A437CGD4_ORYJA|nr:hypothetical protein OJAV_G00169370 [Oryzias javanicus]